jgi:signal transduction histidine kinase
MEDRVAALLALAPSFARPANRPEAWVALARVVGCESIMFFTRDPELDVLLPAPGLPQTLHGAGEWRAFIDRCTREGTRTGYVPMQGGGTRPACCLPIANSSVAVLLGTGAENAAGEAAVPLLELLAALFDAERHAAAEAARAAAAAIAVERSAALTRTVQSMRERLEASLRVAEAARSRAAESEAAAQALAEELHVQASQLEEQAVELELLNEDLAERTREAESARAAAEVANRAKSEFLANMSHELRTPINAIMGYTEILQMGIAGDVSHAQRTHLDRVRATSRHLLTLINDLLDTAKIEAGQMSVRHDRAPIKIAVNDAMGLLAVEAADRGIVVLEDCSEEITYCGDEDRVRQIVINLRSNAIKFTEAGGRVELRASERAEATEPTAASDGGPWMCLEVEDSGIGMTAEELEKIFRPFVQADSGRTRVTGGTGLGLTISRQLARLMGGDLVARSQPGKGSCFTLWLPAGEARAGSIDDTIRVSASSSRRTSAHETLA